MNTAVRTVFLLAIMCFSQVLAAGGVAAKVWKFGFPPDVALGDEVMENCVVKKGSAGPYRITLLKDGHKISSGDRVTVSSHSKNSATLLIASLRPEDVGNYTCTASNAHGSDSVTAALVVNGNRALVPGMPSTARPTQVSLAC